MGLIQLVLILAVIGFLTWLVVTYVPMPDAFKTAIPVIVLIVCILYVLNALGVADLPLWHRKV